MLGSESKRYFIAHTIELQTIFVIAANYSDLSCESQPELGFNFHLITDDNHFWAFSPLALNTGKS